MMIADVALAQTPRVRTPLGDVVGTFANADRTIELYRGIPYATPPVGVRRWRPAEPAQAWIEPLHADRFGPDCVQSSTMDPRSDPATDIYYHPPSLLSEDCLTLNIWAPSERSAGSPRPVMVWIHGGGLTQGSGSRPLYDGTALAQKGVVLITLNYRLGIFGRLAHPELTGESPQHSSGAYDISDLVQALTWVRGNVAGFGGDPQNVTIFGESAGAVYVAALLASPPAAGLFHRAIGQSGGVFYDPMPTLSAAEAKGQEFVQSIGQMSIAQLREMPAAELHAHSRRLRYYVDIPADGYFIPESPCEIYLNGRQHRVPTLLGFNRDETDGYLPPLAPARTYRAYVQSVRSTFAQWGLSNSNVLDDFLSLVPRERWTTQTPQRMLRGYLMTGWEVESWAEMMRRTSSDSYLYYFSHAPNGARAAFHTAEVSYVFNNEATAPRYSPNMVSMPPSEADLELADTMSDIWVAFARTGNPNTGDTQGWRPYGGPQARHFMEFGEGRATARDHFFPEMNFRPVCESYRQR
jgi:para-nitrobenzyl esterase